MDADRLPGLAAGTWPQNLTPTQIIAVYSYYFDRELSESRGHATLDAIGDVPTAAAFADTVFREGINGIFHTQSAINGAIGGLSSQERRRLGFQSADGTIARVKVDGRFGPESLSALRTLVDAGHGADVRGRLADRRLRGPFKAEVSRIEFFR